MHKTRKTRTKKVVSKKNKHLDCPIGLKPFEKEFGKGLTASQLRMSN